MYRKERSRRRDLRSVGTMASSSSDVPVPSCISQRTRPSDVSHLKADDWWVSLEPSRLPHVDFEWRQGCSQIACRVQDASEEDESVPATTGLIRVVDAWIGSGVSASLAGPYQVSEGPLRYVGAEQSFGPAPSASSRSKFLVAAAAAWSGACSVSSNSLARA